MRRQREHLSKTVRCPCCGEQIDIAVTIDHEVFVFDSIAYVRETPKERNSINMGQGESRVSSDGG